MALHTLLVTGTGMAFGRFDCPAGDDAWRYDNQQRGAHLLAFPSTPVWITYPDSAPVVADRHQVMFYSDSQVYRRSLLSADGDHCTFIAVADDVIRPIVREFDVPVADAVPFQFRHTHASIDAHTYLVQRALALCEAPGSGCATQTLYTVVRNCVAAAYRSRQPPARTAAGTRERCRLVEDVKAVIAERDTHMPSLAWVAAQVKTSPYHLTRVFGDVTGLPLHRYLSQMRLRSAVDLVLDHDTGLAVIAHELGFASHAHFTTAFRDLFGITPSNLRRQCSTA